MPKIELTLKEIKKIRVILKRFIVYMKQSPTIYRMFIPYFEDMTDTEELADKIYEIEFNLIREREAIKK